MTLHNKRTTDEAEADFEARAKGDPGAYPQGRSTDDQHALSPEDAEAIGAGYRELITHGSKLHRAVEKREDLRRLMGALVELAEYEAKLRPADEARKSPDKWKPRAAYVLRWELLHHALENENLGTNAHRVLWFIMDRVHRHGLVAWPCANTIAHQLSMRKSKVSECLAALNAGDFIVRTDGHKNSLIWFDDEDDAGHALGGRGASFTFGKAGFGTYEAMVAASRLGASDHGKAAMIANGDDAEVPPGGNFKRVCHDQKPTIEVPPGGNSSGREVPAGGNMGASEVPAGGKTSKPNELLEPRELKEPVEQKSADAPATAQEGSAVDASLQRAKEDTCTSSKGNAVVLAEVVLPAISTSERNELDLDEKRSIDDVELPLALAMIVGKGKPSIKLANLVDVIRNVRQQGIEPSAIREAIQQAAAKANDGASDNSMLGLMTTFVSNLPRFQQTAARKALASTTEANDRDLEQIYRAHEIGKIGEYGATKITGQVVKSACTLHPIPGLTANDVTPTVDQFIGQFANERPTDVIGTLRLWIVETVVKRQYGPLAAQAVAPIKSGSTAWVVPRAMFKALVESYELVPDEARRARGEVDRSDNYDVDESADPDGYQRRQAVTLVQLACAIATDELPTRDPEWWLAHYGRDLQAIAEARTHEVFAALAEFGQTRNERADRLEFSARCEGHAKFFGRVVAELGRGVAKGPAYPPKRKPGFN